MGPFKELPKLEDVEARPEIAQYLFEIQLDQLVFDMVPKKRDFMLILVYQVCCF